MISKAAIEAFETQNGIGVDGIAGPAVWTALINDTINRKIDATPYVYVLVNKACPRTSRCGTTAPPSTSASR